MLVFHSLTIMIVTEELATLLHVDRSTYAYYELGKTKPSFHTVAWLAHFYQVTLDELLTINLKNLQIPFSNLLTKDDR